MAWFLHILERGEGSWHCRHGLTEYDAHPELSTAVYHMHELAANAQPALLQVHPTRRQHRPGRHDLEPQHAR